MFSKTLIDTIFALQLSLFGITITIFTVLYSFILSKKSELHSLSEMSNFSKKADPLLEQKISFATVFIKKIRSLNTHFFALGLLTLLLSISSFIITIFSFDLLDISKWILFILCCLSLIYVLVLLVIVGIKYFDQIKTS